MLLRRPLLFVAASGLMLPRFPSALMWSGAFAGQAKKRTEAAGNLERRTTEEADELTRRTSEDAANLSRRLVLSLGNLNVGEDC